MGNTDEYWLMVDDVDFLTQECEEARDLARGLYHDREALLAFIDELIAKNQSRRIDGAWLKLPPHLRERIERPR